MSDAANAVEPEVSSQSDSVTQNSAPVVDVAEPAVADPAAEPAVETAEGIISDIAANVAPDVAPAGAEITSESTVDTPMDASWLSLSEIRKLPSFQKLTKTSAMLLLEFWRTGSRLKAVESVLEVEGEPARLACLLFDKGNLREAILDMTNVSQKDRVLSAITRALRSKKVTPEKLALLKLQAKIILGVDADDEGDCAR